MSRTAQTLSVVCTSAFAGGCLVVSVVLVPTWREMDPEAFLDWFPENGPRLGLTIFPLEAAGALFAVLAFFGAVRRRSNRGRGGASHQSSRRPAPPAGPWSTAGWPASRHCPPGCRHHLA